VHRLARRPCEHGARGALFSDGGGAREGSGVDGLPLRPRPRQPWTRCARIGDPASTWADGVISAVNETARRAGVAVGQPASTAARAMLAHRRSW